MDILIVVIGLLLIVVGILGSFLPILPGPPLAYFALPILYFHSNVLTHPTGKLLSIYALVVIIITVADYYLPVWGTKKFGGTNAGKRGSVAGLILSIIFPVAGPFTILIGPFVGAIAGELIAGQNTETAWKSGVGSFLGFMAGTLLKLAIVIMIGWKFVTLIW
ncbi:MAG: DUF456 family protein [Bacteroidetes bacterium]|nr:DUF456 family protein [Bacteroidota bacterium]